MLIVPLVGAYFRPPAKLLLSIMPTGAKLELRPEPSNPYDPNAIAVWAAASSISLERLQSKEEELQGAGDCPDFGNQEEVEAWRTTPRHLGYVARKDTAKVFALAMGSDDSIDLPAASLCFLADGNPACKVDQFDYLE
jgi:hypothetical protein